MTCPLYFILIPLFDLHLKSLLFKWMEVTKYQNNYAAAQGLIPSVMHFSPAHHLFLGRLRNHFSSSKCHLKSNTPTDHLVPPNSASIQHSMPKLWSSLGKLSIPNPSLPWHQLGFQWLAQEVWMLALQRPTAAKWSAVRTRVRRKREEGKGLLPGTEWTAMVCKNLIWPSSHIYM